MTGLFPLQATAVYDAFAISLAVKIRTCEKADLPLLEWEGAFTEHRGIIQHVYRLQSVGESLMLIADANNYPVGQIWIDFHRRRSIEAGYLWAIRVWPAFQRKGVGKRLVHAAEGVLKERGYSLAELSVETWNVCALKLYERLGYRRIEKFCENFEYLTPEGSVKLRLLEEWRLRKRIA